MSIVLSQWFVQGVLQNGGVLAIDPEYFSITGGRERWLYRVARKHAGGAGADGFAITLPTLYEKSGAEGPYRRFKFELQKLVKRNDLPSVDLRWEEPEGKEPRIRMTMRRALGEGEVMEGARTKPRKPRPKAKPKPPPGEPMALFLRRDLDDQTIARIRKDFPGWDIYALKAEYDAWIDANPDKRPKDYQKAFYGFVRQYHQREKHTLHG